MKVDVRNVENLDNPASAVGALNYNFQQIQAIIETLLSRDGRVPNSMLSLLDMNNNRVVNLPVPISSTEPARHGDIQQYVDQAEAAADFADERADVSDTRATDAETAAILAEDALEEFLTRYLGVFTEHPTENPFTNEPLVDGALYYNTTIRTWYVYYKYTALVNTLVVSIGLTPVTIEAWEPIPRSTLRTLSDTEENILNNQIYQWNEGQQKFLNIDLSAENVSASSTIFDGATVQAFFDELETRVSLGYYDISFWMEGLMEDGETLFRLVSVRDFELTDSHVAKAGTAANSQTTLSLRRNGSQIGTITFAAASDTGVFNITPGYTFLPGDALDIRAPLNADTALRDVAITLTARR